MRKRGKRVLPAVYAVSSLFLLTGTAQAAQISSTNYMINGNLGGTFGGSQSSTSYKMTSIGGETIVGQGSSASYVLDQQLTPAPSMQLAVQPNGLLGYYPLDENTGTTAADGSSNQNNGTLSGTPTWNTSGKIGSAVSINGPTDSTGTGAVTIPNNVNLPSGSAMTVEAWVNQDAWYQNQAIASVWQYSTSGSWALQTGTNRNLRLYLAPTATDTATTYVDTAANSWNSFASWHHVVATYDGTLAQASRVHIYIDGVDSSTTVTGTLPSSLVASTAPLSLGSFPGLGRSLSGSLDQVKLFNRVLSPAEVSAEYTAQTNGVPTGFAFPTVISTSVTAQQDAIIRTNVSNYSLSIQQDHNLQGTPGSIPAISAVIASPAAWTEGTTRGLGFTITASPITDSRWGSGANYAAFPAAATTIYSGTGHVSSTVDVIKLKFRLGTASNEASGAYSNTVTYTGTMLP